MTDIALIILAAGKGTRMKSTLPKVMHRVAGRSLLGHVLHAGAALTPHATVVVAGPEMEQVKQEAERFIPNANLVIQRERNGTAHAVKITHHALADFVGTIIILYGDVPLIRPETIAAMATALCGKASLAILGFRAADPTGYGRIVHNEDGQVIAIREELDASTEERKINLCNSGVISISAAALWPLLSKVNNHNAKKEFYLTDIVELAVSENRTVAVVECPEHEVMGVNDRGQLAVVERALQDSYRQAALTGGATLVSPETVYFSADTVIGSDVVIEPNVYFGPGVKIADNVTVHGFSHLEGTIIDSGARVGPFARLRPGAMIGSDSHVGNFVEVKNATIEKGVKVNHLSYIGDARVGAKSNIGAGTITCNYDGFEKHLTDIGTEVFVGSNSALVAPVRIGDGANIGAGSVITKDVPAHALALTRGPLEVKAGWAAKYREIKMARKKGKV